MLDSILCFSSRMLVSFISLRTAAAIKEDDSTEEPTVDGLLGLSFCLASILLSTLDSSSSINIVWLFEVQSDMMFAEDEEVLFCGAKNASSFCSRLSVRITWWAYSLPENKRITQFNSILIKTKTWRKKNTRLQQRIRIFMPDLENTNGLGPIGHRPGCRKWNDKQATPFEAKARQWNIGTSRALVLWVEGPAEQKTFASCSKNADPSLCIKNATYDSCTLAGPLHESELLKSQTKTLLAT